MTIEQRSRRGSSTRSGREMKRSAKTAFAIAKDLVLREQRRELAEAEAGARLDKIEAELIGVNYSCRSRQI